ncbi:MAG TPA: hypothetical protein VJW17_03550, partial [Pyrinomonadaceae bacterium]|nr:hypothetical protein [Pyrinomonadaceae bacterium]
ARIAALSELMAQLAEFNNLAWWQTDVDQLNACDFKGSAGAFTPEERQTFTRGDYPYWLFGDNQIRLVLVSDPCYQTQYNGSNGFLLYRRGGRIFVSQVLDGYFSRADNSVNLGFGRLDQQLLLEISTGSGGLYPTLTNYYFVLDPKTNKAVPKKLFAGEHGPTNEISSSMLFGDVSPARAPLNIIRRGGTLAPSFNVYVEGPDGKIEDNGRTYSRTVMHWNGKIYR